LHRPPEPVVRRLRAGMGIDGYYFIHQLGPAISAWRVALQLAVLISSRRVLLILRWERPERHPPLALQLLPSLHGMTDRTGRTFDGERKDGLEVAADRRVRDAQLLGDA